MLLVQGSGLFMLLGVHSRSLLDSLAIIRVLSFIESIILFIVIMCISLAPPVATLPEFLDMVRSDRFIGRHFESVPGLIILTVVNYWALELK